MLPGTRRSLTLPVSRSTLFFDGLALNEAKTSVRDARRERFDFLGYTFGPHTSTVTRTSHGSWQLLIE